MSHLLLISAMSILISWRKRKNWYSKNINIVLLLKRTMLSFPPSKLSAEACTHFLLLSLQSTLKLVEMRLLKAFKIKISFKEIQNFKYCFYWPKMFKLALMILTLWLQWCRRKVFLWFASSKSRMSRPLSKRKTSGASPKIISAF